MKIPATPPSFSDISKYIDGKHTEFLSLHQKIPASDKYLHWDDLRYRPVPDNLSSELYWLATKMSRSSTKVELPLIENSKINRPFHFTRPDILLSKLRKVDLKSGGVVTAQDKASVDIDSQRYLTRSILEEPFSSSVLEGAATTRQKAKAMIDNGDTPRSKDDRMVLNNYRAMAFIKENKSEPLSPDLIRECHRIITTDTLEDPDMSGHYRANDEINVGDDFGNIFHQPPPFKELEGRMDRLCAFANMTEEQSDRFIHPVIKAITLHFMLAFDHPFIDGNGRTARALFYWSLLNSNYWIMEFVSISAIIKRAPIKYGKAFLHTETDEADLTYFLLHQLDVILTALNELDDYLEKQKHRHAQADRLILDQKLNARQRSLLIEFSRRRLNYTTIHMHEKQESVSYLTARSDLERLADNNWLIKDATGRPTKYLPGQKLKEITVKK